VSELRVDAVSKEEAASALKPHRWPVERVAFLLVLAATGAILLGLVLAILKLNNGTFIYSMDDPYIALALSDQISHGNYGINAGQHAAPASSILFPFLLAAAAGTSLHPYLPLLINCLRCLRRWLSWVGSLHICGWPKIRLGWLRRRLACCC
jgi:hypothetical protein